MSKRPATRLHLLRLLKLHEIPENIVLISMKRMVTFQHLATYGRELRVRASNSFLFSPGFGASVGLNKFNALEQHMHLPKQGARR